MDALSEEPEATVTKTSPATNRFRISKRNVLLVAIIFGLIGGFFVWRTFALTPVVATLEVEKMTQPVGATTVDDSTLSGGKAVKMSKNGSFSGTVNLPTKTSSLAVKAKGVRCRGKWPQVSVQVDGNNALPATSVSSSNWTSYTANTVLNSGTHAINISASNVLGCRAVYLDVLTFYGPAIISPAPTVSFSASPTSLTSGGSGTLTWSSTNAASCTASGAWSGSKPMSGSVSTGALSATSVYNLSCTGNGGSATASVSVAVSAPPPTATTKSIYWGSRIDSETYGSTEGDAPWSYTTWDTFESHTGKKVSILHYGQPPMWDQAFVPNVANLVTSRGAIPLISMGTNSVPLTDITNGVYDASIISWADSVKTWGKPFFLRWNWEMNGAWFGWGAQAKQNPANFVAAWKHIHDVVASRGANNVTWVWCPNALFSGSTPLNQLYPGDSYVDWTCIDGYNKASVGNIYYYSWQSFSQVFQNTYNQILTLAPSKPIMIAETGSNEGGGSKAAWLTDALQTQLPVNYPKIKAFVWFNWPIYEDGAYQQWPIESSPSSQDAFKAGIQSPYYAGNNYGNLPALTKVQPIQ